MICTEFWNGSGCGNQLHLYVTTRCIALDNGYKWGIMHSERFKGKSFMNLDFGEKIEGGITQIEGTAPIEFPIGFERYYKEVTGEFGEYDENLTKIPDNTKIDGLMQGEKYFEKHKDEIREWLKVEPLEMPDDLCIINFRGGEYRYVPSFFLPRAYWDNAIKNMRKINPDMRFEVHTDDPETARQFFDFPIISNIGINWRTIRYAKYLIISNSSFAIFPSFLNTDVKLTIAPKYFARFNTEEWFLRQNIYKGMTYMDKNGNLDNQ